LNNTDPNNLQTNNTSPGTQEISDSINALLVRDYLAYLLTNHQLQILRVDNPLAISTFAPAQTLVNASTGTSLDCEGDIIYAGSADSSNNGYITIIQPGL
jgi:hypothetical protein